jgi:hypothetical protein
MTSDIDETGVPCIADAKGWVQTLERMPLAPQGKGAFDEAWLQRLVHANPACLPISEIEPGLASFVAICRELPTPRGNIDNLLMTGAGDIAIVETKLFRNPEARRQVLAQALDYALAVFAMGYGAFESAVLKGQFDPRDKPSSLYAALPDADKLDESRFVDAVASNLRSGRALILIAGDGIRSEAQDLLAGLPAHARFGFSLALVELAVFQMPDADRFLIRPRTLAKTAIVERTVVEIVGGAAATVRQEHQVVPETLTTEAYWQALGANVPGGARRSLEALITAAEPIGVRPEFLGSLNLKWDRPNGKPLNLGYITKLGVVWTDAASWFASQDLARTYVEEVAAAFDCEARALPNSNSWSLYRGGKPLRLASVLDRLIYWPDIMQRFITRVQKHDAETA